jgi:hypothetical protein
VRRTSRALAGLAGILIVGPAGAATVYVNRDAPGVIQDGATWQTAFITIQPALDAAKPGDEVWVTGNRYAGGLTLRTPHVALYGGFSAGDTNKDRLNPSFQTRILPLNADPLVTITPEALGAVWDNFDLARGEDSMWAHWATIPGPGIIIQAADCTIRRDTIHGCGAINAESGGVSCMAGSSATFAECIICNNTARDGGGIVAKGAVLTVVNSTVRENDAMASSTNAPEYIWDGRGGGIAVLGGSANIVHTTITGNVSRHGGGLWADGAAVSFARNWVEDNAALRESPSNMGMVVQVSGGGVGLSNCTADVRNNVFALNMVYGDALPGIFSVAEVQGGGLAFIGGSGSVVNNTFVGNLASAIGLQFSGNGSTCMGGGASIWATANVANNIFSDNRATLEPDSTAYGNALASNGTVQAFNLYDTNVVSDPSPSPFEHGSIEANPMFQAGSPRYKPITTSPAVDGGEASFVHPGEVDITGASRIQGLRVDMGAYEAATPPGPSRVYVSPSGSDANDGTTWATAKQSIRAALRAVAMDGAVWVREGVYQAGLDIPSHVSLYGGFQGAEDRLEQRDYFHHASVIAGDGGGTLISISSTAQTVRVDGFTIRGGGATGDMGAYSASGITSAGKDVVIVNNTVSDIAASYYEDNPSAWASGINAGGGPVTIANNSVRNVSATAIQGMTYPQFSNYASAYAVGITVGGGDVTVANNVVAGVTARVGGAPSNFGVEADGIAGGNIAGRIVNNTIVNSHGSAVFFSYPAPDAYGYGISLGGNTTGLTVANNVIAYNSTGVSASSTDAFSHNCFYGNIYGSATGGADPIGVNGNILADPLFASLGAGDYHLQLLSPCVDAGDNAAVWGDTDLDGRTRVIAGTVDIGAYETTYAAAYTIADAASALRIAAGLSAPSPALVGRLNVAGDNSRVDVADAVLLARKAVGKDRNP